MSEETGGTLREKLEAALADNRKLQDQIKSFEMQTIASELPLVKPEDLEGVDLGELRERATEIQEKRAADQRELLGKAGLSEEQIEAVMSGETVTTGGPSEGFERLRTVGTAGGSRPETLPDSQYEGYDAIRAHFTAKKK